VQGPWSLFSVNSKGLVGAQVRIKVDALPATLIDFSAIWTQITLTRELGAIKLLS